MPSLNLRRIEAFLAVFEARNMTRAAVQLEVAQSVVTRHVAALEAQLGCRLFARTGRGVAPTPAGEQLAPRLRAAIDEMQRAANEAADIGEGPSGIVRLGVVPGAARPLVGMLYQRLCERFPRIGLQFVEGFSNPLEDQMADGQLDLAIVNTDDADSVIKGSDTPVLVIDVWVHAYYIDKRNAMIEAVTMGDLKRAARRLLGDGKVFVVAVGRPTLKTGG